MRVAVACGASSLQETRGRRGVLLRIPIHIDAAAGAVIRELACIRELLLRIFRIVHDCPGALVVSYEQRDPQAEQPDGPGDVQDGDRRADHG
jgi:hypothetical protein